MLCFLLVQLGALKIDAHPWLIQCSPFGCFTTFVLKSTLSVPDFHGEHNHFIFEMCLVNYWLLVLRIVLGQVISALLSDFFIQLIKHISECLVCDSTGSAGGTFGAFFYETSRDWCPMTTWESLVLSRGLGMSAGCANEDSRHLPSANPIASFGRMVDQSTRCVFSYSFYCLNWLSVTLI